MATNLLASDASVESSSSALNWGPIIAGAIAAATLTLVLMLLGSGLGLTITSPWPNESASLTTVAASTIIWLVVVQWLSSAFGGFLTGRLRTKWVQVHSGETEFRDTAHGFLAWAVATLVVASLFGSVLSAIAGTAARTVAATAPRTAAAIVPDQTSYLVDGLFRTNDPARLAAPGMENDTAYMGQATRILVASAAAGKITPEDQAYLGQLVASRTGLSPADASARVSAAMTQIDAAKARAQEAADKARKTAAVLALLGTLALMIGAFIASVAAALGGRMRDDEEAAFLRNN